MQGAPSTRVLCVYAAHAPNLEYAENVRRFARGGGVLPHVHYVFVVNEGGLPLDLPAEGELPNVRVLRRPNEGYDFGAWAHALSLLEAEGGGALQDRYSHFVFVNSSVRGPCVARPGRDDWTLPLLALLRGSVALAGLTINVLPVEAYGGAAALAAAYGLRGWRVLPHVQSMLFATDARGLARLRSFGIFDPVPAAARLPDVVLGRELRMSAALLALGCNISCLAQRYAGLDYAGGAVRSDPNPTSVNGDPFFPGAYWGSTLDPREVLFFKTSRLGGQLEQKKTCGTHPPPSPPDQEKG